MDQRPPFLSFSDRSTINSQPSTRFPPLCLSSYRASFVNSYSSVQVRPEAPFHGDHDVTAASRPVTAFVPVRIRLVTPISIQGRQGEVTTQAGVQALACAFNLYPVGRAVQAAVCKTAE